MTAQQEVGTAIMQARKSLGLTQTQLGQRLGIKKARVSLVERGVNLTVESLSRVFGALGVEAWLVVGEERIGLSESHIEDNRGE